MDTLKLFALGFYLEVEKDKVSKKICLLYNIWGSFISAS